MFRGLGLVFMMALWMSSCKGNPQKAAPSDQTPAPDEGGLKVMEVRVVDLSESGSPFQNLAPPFMELLKDPSSEAFVETGATGQGELVIELANFCLPAQCFIGARTTLSLREKSGLSHRFFQQHQEPLEGLKFLPSLQRLAPRVHRAVRLWIQGLKVHSDTIGRWLKSPDAEKRRAGLQAMLDRDLVSLTEDLGPLLEDEVRENQDLAIALACVYKHKNYIPILRKVALRDSLRSAWASLQCLGHYPPEQTNGSIREISRHGVLDQIKEEALRLMKARNIKDVEAPRGGSSAAPNSDTKEPNLAPKDPINDPM